MDNIIARVSAVTLSRGLPESVAKTKKFTEFVTTPLLLKQAELVFYKKCHLVPGIGPAIAELLNKAKITHVGQLIGRYFICKRDKTTFNKWFKKTLENAAALGAASSSKKNETCAVECFDAIDVWFETMAKQYLAYNVLTQKNAGDYKLTLADFNEGRYSVANLGGCTIEQFLGKLMCTDLW